MLSDKRLDAIDNAIRNLEDDRADLVREIQAACEHEWEDDFLFHGAKICRKCQLGDHSNACSRIDWPQDQEWPYDVSQRHFCWRHKRSFKECELALR